MRLRATTAPNARRREDPASFVRRVVPTRDATSAAPASQIQIFSVTTFDLPRKQ